MTGQSEDAIKLMSIQNNNLWGKTSRNREEIKWNKQMYGCARGILLRLNSKFDASYTFLNFFFSSLIIQEAAWLWYIEREFVGLVGIFDINVK